MKKVLFVLFLLFLTYSGYSQIFSRKVLFEELTNASCGPCAQNNPMLKSYIDSKGDSIIAIKYHGSFPGYDPMYIHNPTQSAERYNSYYGMNAAPWLNVDGIVNDVWPFTLANFNNAFYGRVGIPSPLLVTVIDQRITGDSIKAAITVYKPAGLPSGNYKLRVMAVEKVVLYSTPPGTNGETIFEHVFRKAFPNTAGTTINTNAGTENFVFTYKILPEWLDSSMVTIAFVQNDNNREVLNVGKGGTGVTGISGTNSEIPAKCSLSQNYPNPFNPITNIKFSIPDETVVSLKIFDILGREAAVLIDKKLTAGNYTADWDASAYSSGIYFYTLKTKEFTETRKMVLIK